MDGRKFHRWYLSIQIITEVGFAANSAYHVLYDDGIHK